MSQILHIITHENDSLAEKIISAQRHDSKNQIETVDLTRGEPDYKGLLEKIFAADSVQVW